jgi:hypothetical protein
MHDIELSHFDVLSVNQIYLQHLSFLHKKSCKNEGSASFKKREEETNWAAEEVSYIPHKAQRKIESSITKEVTVAKEKGKSSRC